MKHYLLKTTLRLLMAAVMVYLLPMMAWGQGTQPSGSGNSAGDPYQISTRDNLEWMADQIANQSTTFDGKFFKLQNDIDLGGTAWAPIGIPDSHFKGTFDGDGYTISGLYIPATNPAKKNRSEGLFGEVGQNGTIKNLGVEIASGGIHICAPNNSEPTLSLNAGGIAGRVRSGTIENCYVTGGGIYWDGDLDGVDANMGGISGRSDVTI